MSRFTSAHLASYAYPVRNTTDARRYDSHMQHENNYEFSERWYRAYLSDMYHEEKERARERMAERIFERAAARYEALLRSIDADELRNTNPEEASIIELAVPRGTIDKYSAAYHGDINHENQLASHRNVAEQSAALVDNFAAPKPPCQASSVASPVAPPASISVPDGDAEERDDGDCRLCEERVADCILSTMHRICRNCARDWLANKSTCPWTNQQIVWCRTTYN